MDRAPGLAMSRWFSCALPAGLGDVILLEDLLELEGNQLPEARNRSHWPEVTVTSAASAGAGRVT